MPGISKKSKGTPSHLSYIVPATDDESHWITQRDLACAKVQRDKQFVRKIGDRTTVDGFQTTVNSERGDRNMLNQIMTYLATPEITPMEMNAPFCGAFAHTTDLTPIATVDRSSVSFRAPHLSFDTVTLLKQMMVMEKRDNGRNGVFAPFSAKHVKKVMRVIPNFEMKTMNGLVSDYHVEMCILTGFGILVARGFLYLQHDELKNVDLTTTARQTFKGSHINWHTWGFDAERRWESPWKFACVGAPFS